MRNCFKTTLTTLALGAVATTTLAAGYEPANSLAWPLLDEVHRQPRPALGSTFGEYQSYGGDRYVHTGLDIRGRAGDPVRLVASGNIWFTQNFQEDTCETGTSCRLYVKGDDGRYIYYYSHLRLYNERDETTSEVRNQIVSAIQNETSDYVVQDGTHVDEGQILAGLSAFGGSAAPWPHLHFSIIDATQNYDAIHPLTALDRSGPRLLIDEERPSSWPPALRMTSSDSSRTGPVQPSNRLVNAENCPIPGPSTSSHSPRTRS